MDTKKRNIIIGVVAAIVIIGGICGGIAYANYQEEQRQIAEHNAAVDTLAVDYGSQIDALALDADSENPDRATLLTNLDGLEKLAKSITEDADKLTYFDGSKSQFDDLQSKALQQINAIRAWFQTNYSNQFDAAKIADLEAEGVSKDQIQESTQKLTELQTLIESEATHSIWGENDTAKREELTTSISSSIEANNAKMAAIEEAERQEAEEAQAQAAASGSYAGGYDGGYNGGYDGGSNSGGGGAYWITYGDETRYYNSRDEMWDGWAGDHPGIVRNPSNDNHDVPDSDLIGKGK